MTEEVAVESRSNSGVYRAISTLSLTQLRRDLTAATERVSTFRSDILARRDQVSIDDVGWKALQEIDTAHEELRVAEEELHAQADELIATRSMLERERRVYGELFEAAPEAYLVTDERGVVIQANRRASSLFNLSSGFLIGKPLISLLSVTDRDRFRDVLDVMHDTIVQVQLRIQPRKEQNPTWVSISAQRGVRDESAICIRWLLRSIDAEKQEEARRAEAEEQLQNKIRELEAARRSLGHLLEREQLARREADDLILEKERVFAEVAHELRSPLGSMAGWLHLYAQSEESDASTRSRALSSMTRSVRALARIVEDLVSHARVENHAAVVRAAPLNLIRVIVHVVEDLKPLIELKKIRIEVSGSRHKVEVNGDPWHLQQVFRNLLGNAIKFTPEQGSIRVTVSVVEMNVDIAVTDSGPGIERSALKKIFRPFTKLNASGRHSGLGLGLSIAQRLVELHGGTIVAESEGQGHGSTFRVRLPIAISPN